MNLANSKDKYNMKSKIIVRKRSIIDYVKSICKIPEKISLTF